MRTRKHRPPVILSNDFVRFERKNELSLLTCFARCKGKSDILREAFAMADSSDSHARQWTRHTRSKAALTGAAERGSTMLTAMAGKCSADPDDAEGSALA
ncbi:hypothetical protein JAK58_10630 [Stenotrophomonas maltophilia]|uniref:hypothetical protein n=1 Tax=Stenotrophomonas maltophilia TaxID=40324 RepID=UPI0021C7D900|nr:hypothetical protein [Stenotrophomonas maltophilia]MCU1091968.1 hypothetical protein [Stenotrophomonas maltophilia]